MQTADSVLAVTRQPVQAAAGNWKAWAGTQHLPEGGHSPTVSDSDEHILLQLHRQLEGGIYSDHVLGNVHNNCGHQRHFPRGIFIWADTPRTHCDNCDTILGSLFSHPPCAVETIVLNTIFGFDLLYIVYIDIKNSLLCVYNTWAIGNTLRVRQPNPRT